MKLKRDTDPASDPLVYVILVNWNGWRDTLECLQSLEKLDYLNHRVLVVDNGSTDDSLVRLRSGNAGAELIENGENLGFAKACNVGIRKALAEGAEFVWRLDNDTVVEPDCLRALVERATQGGRIGAVGSVLYYMDHPNSVQAWAGGYINLWLGRSRHFTAPISENRLDFINGASMLVRREALDEVGLLDERYFVYFEDADFSIRLRRAGWRLAVAEKSLIWHKESSSMVKRSLRQETIFSTSGVRFLRSHAVIPWVSIGTFAGLRLMRRILRGDWARVRAVWNGLRAAQG